MWDIGDNPSMFTSDYDDRKDLGDGRYWEYDHHRNPEEIGKYYWNLYEKYGCYNWYDWSNKYWGTKWNACDSYIVDDNNINFSTAWCTPEPIWKSLSKKYPNVQVKVSATYEEGYLVDAVYINGKCVSVTEKEFNDDTVW